jgi:hypothetical protein
MQRAVYSFKAGAPAFSKSDLLHGGKNPFGDALDDVGAESIFPSCFVFAGTGKGDERRRGESRFFREPLEFAAAPFFIGQGSSVLPNF